MGKYDGTTTVEVRSTRRLAEAYIQRYADVQGEQNYWDGQKFVPIFVEWFIVREHGKYIIRQTITSR